MDESTIAAQQLQKIQREAPQQPVISDAPVNTDQSTIQLDTPLEPMIAYKLADLFQESYNTTDTEKTDRLKYLYDQATQATGSSEWFDVAKYLRGVIDLIGARGSLDPIGQAYQWLRLDETRRNAEREQMLYVGRG